VCTELWVRGAPSADGPAPLARFPGGFREWREAAAGGWTVEGAMAGRRSGVEAGPAPNPAPKAVAPKTTRPARTSPPRVTLSKDAYRRRRQVVEGDLTRLGLRKSQLELALADPRIQGNFVELRRVTTELADVDAALALAEDAWLVLAEQAPR
jgi:hypothetical protein